jgi:hypothetical protein
VQAGLVLLYAFVDGVIATEFEVEDDGLAGGILVEAVDAALEAERIEVQLKGEFGAGLPTFLKERVGLEATQTAEEADAFHFRSPAGGDADLLQEGGPTALEEEFEIAAALVPLV